jgi:hypothetical protein
MVAAKDPRAGNFIMGKGNVFLLLLLLLNYTHVTHSFVFFCSVIQYLPTKQKYSVQDGDPTLGPDAVRR